VFVYCRYNPVFVCRNKSFARASIKLLLSCVEKFLRNEVAKVNIFDPSGRNWKRTNCSKLWNGKPHNFCCSSNSIKVTSLKEIRWVEHVGQMSGTRGARAWYEEKHQNFTKTLISIISTTIFIIQGCMFRPFKRSSSGLLTDWDNRRPIKRSKHVVLYKKNSSADI
jgi:hypothetical protein